MMQMDSIDYQIFKCLKENSRENATAIGAKIKLSTSAVIERIRKLEAAKIIKQYTTVIDHEKIGKDITAFISVRLEHPKYNDGFNQMIMNNDNIIECHYIAGDFDFLKISTTNTPIHSLQGAAPARYWQVSAPAPNDSNTVNGIIIRSAEVCKVDIQGTRPANGGSINYFMGVLANVVPVAVPAVTGTTTVGSTVTGSYTYSDSESDPEDTTAGGTQYKFVTSPNASIASSADGTTVASGATGGAGASVTYTLQSGDRNQYLFYCVTPAAASGASPGLEVCTPATGPVTDKPAPPVTTTPQPVPSLSAFSAAGLGALMLALFGWVGRRRAGRH